MEMRTKALTPWMVMKPSDIICHMASMPLKKTSFVISTSTVELDTTDVFTTKKIMGTTSTLMQFETCCVNNPLWLSDEITHRSYTIKSSTFHDVAEGLPSHPDPICKKDMFQRTTNCNSKLFKIDKQDSIYYSPIHGFPQNLECEVSSISVISCKDKQRHSTFSGTFPSVSSKAKNCPVTWIKTDIIIHQEDTSYFVDFKDIRVARGKVVCELTICDKKWVGLSQGLLILAPHSVLSTMVLTKCGSDFNYAFDITSSQHEEIKNGLKELRKNDRCELLRQTEDDSEPLTSLILEWETFPTTARNPPIIQGCR